MRNTVRHSFFINQLKVGYRISIIFHINNLILFGGSTCGSISYTHLNNTAARLEAKGEILEVLHFRFFIVL